MRHRLLPLATLVVAPVVSTAVADTVETFATLPQFFEDVSAGPDGSLYLPGGTNAFRVHLDGTIEQISSTMHGALGGVVDSEGNYYVSCFNAAHVHRVNADGTETIVANSVSTPTGLLLSPDEQTLYVALYTPGRVISIDLVTGARQLLASGPSVIGPDGLALDDDGNLYIANFLIPQITKVDPEGNETVFVVMPGTDTGYIDYRDGYLYVAGLNSHRIYRVSTADGTIETIAGTGVAGTTDGPAETAQLNVPNGLALSPGGEYLWFQTQNLLRRIVFDGTVAVGDAVLPAPLSLRVHPNPTDGLTRVHLTLEEDANVRATVHDVQGRLVRELSGGRLSAGAHALSWNGRSHDGREAAAGVYHVRLRIGEGTRTVRVVRLTR